MNRLLAFAAIAEAATGLALLLLPSLVGQWLFGEDLISEKSLDEVILSYLAEDLGDRR